MTSLARRLLVAAVIALAFVSGSLTGCSTDRDQSDFFAPDGEGTPVVDATMIVGRSFPTVIVTRAARPDEQFFLDNIVIEGATVTITDDSLGAVMMYSEVLRGRYRPNGTSVLVEANRTYNLRVVTQEGEVVTATTTTPAPYHIDRWVVLDNTGTTVERELKSFEEVGDDVYVENQLVYSEGLIEARFTELDVPSYQVGIFSLDFDSDLAIDPAFLDDEDLADLERFISTPALESINGTLRLPWFVIFYTERYKLRVFALDQNWFDLIRSVPELGGGPGFGGNIGDNFERPIFHVEGGIGLFGSASVDSIGFFVLPRP